MSIRIGKVVIPKSPQARYRVEGYIGGALAIRGYVRSEEDRNLTQERLYLLKEGSIEDIEIMTDDGGVRTGLHRINELTWRTEKKNGDYELMFNIGLQKQ